MSEHTPGPIKDIPLDGAGTIIRIKAEAGTPIATLGPLQARCKQEVLSEQIANARLLTAAYNSYDKHCGPNAVAAAEGDLLGELLEVCGGLLRALREYTDEGETSAQTAILNAAEAAIAKAQEVQK